jgi:hypothetical protein
MLLAAVPAKPPRAGTPVLLPPPHGSAAPSEACRILCYQQEVYPVMVRERERVVLRQRVSTDPGTATNQPTPGFCPKRTVVRTARYASSGTVGRGRGATPRPHRSCGGRWSLLHADCPSSLTPPAASSHPRSTPLSSVAATHRPGFFGEMRKFWGPVRIYVGADVSADLHPEGCGSERGQERPRRG